jgi:hypothetical protein
MSSKMMNREKLDLLEEMLCFEAVFWGNKNVHRICSPWGPAYKSMTCWSCCYGSCNPRVAVTPGGGIQLHLSITLSLQGARVEMLMGEKSRPYKVISAMTGSASNYVTS